MVNIRRDGIDPVQKSSIGARFYNLANAVIEVYQLALSAAIASEHIQGKTKAQPVQWPSGQCPLALVP